MSPRYESVADIRRKAVIESLEWILDQHCTQPQRDAFLVHLRVEKISDTPDDKLEWAYNLVVRTAETNKANGVKPDPVRQIDDPIRRTDAELWSALDWAYERKKQKPWFPDNDSPKMMTTCNAYIALVEEVLELRGYKSREHVRH